MTLLDARITEALQGPRFALIGAGQLGAMALDMWPVTRPRPEFCLDSAKSGQLADLPVYDLKTHEPVSGVTYLLSAFKLPVSDVQAIFNRLGQDLILTVYDLFEETIPDWFSNGWRNLEPDSSVQARLNHLANDYADDLSAQAVAAASAWRYQRELMPDYPVGPESAKYDLSLFGRHGCHYHQVLDLGAFDLGFQDSLEKVAVRYDHYLAFEADPRCVAQCEDRKSRLDPDRAAKTRIANVAISEDTKTRRFLACGLLAARLLDENAPPHPDEIRVNATSLDHYAGLDQVSHQRLLIKLHIEGEELPALRGVAALLEKNQCDILANLSHTESQFLDVPSFIRAFGQHEVYLRSHSLFGEGLTLFAKYRH
ncbi:MAG: methyltransferase [Pseudomonadota bacterium]